MLRNGTLGERRLEIRVNEMRQIAAVAAAGVNRQAAKICFEN